MGPLVVNEDGTAKRIANWAEMTAGERETTMRVPHGPHPSLPPSLPSFPLIILLLPPRSRQR